MTKEEDWLLNEKYAGEETPAFFADCKRLEAGEPLDYVIGWKDFLGCRIHLSKRPLIPREETAYWVEKIIEEMRQENRPLRVLDLFSGSGCTGIAVLSHLSDAHVTFADSEKSCIEQIRINLEQNGMRPERFEVLQSDLFERIAGTFDWILANPPYIATSHSDRVQKSVTEHEPARALWGGADGLVVIRRFLAEATAHLAPKGGLAMEFDDIQKEALEELFKALPYARVRFEKDQYGSFRFVLACRE